MRRFIVSSVLLGMTSLVSAAQAQNYVQPKNYGNPDVIVNMDTLGAVPNSGLVPTPVYQRPLLPPVPMPSQTTQQPLVLRPPVPKQMASAPVIAPAPLPPAEIVEAKPPVPLNETAPSSMVAAGPAPVKPAPFEARDVADLGPPPAPLPNPKPAPVDEPKKAGIVDNSDMETPVPGPAASDVKKAEPKKAEIVTDHSDMETPVATDTDTKPTVPLKPASLANPANNPARTLLAQARDKAEGQDAAKREEVLFDEAPKTDKKLTPPSTAVLKPQPLPAALPPAGVPKLVETTPPPAMPAPMPLASAEKADETIKPNAQVAMLKPTPLSETPKEVQQASTMVDNFEAYRLLYSGSAAELKPSEQSVLDNIIRKLQNEPNTKLQLRAYADGTPDTTAQARRIALTRALNVRTYLVQKGIPATRLDVRALGEGSTAMGDQVGTNSIPPDRVDVIFVR